MLLQLRFSHFVCLHNYVKLLNGLSELKQTLKICIKEFTLGEWHRFQPERSSNKENSQQWTLSRKPQGSKSEITNSKSADSSGEFLQWASAEYRLKRKGEDKERGRTEKVKDRDGVRSGGNRGWGFKMATGRGPLISAYCWQ